ncbi:hypothetical protein [Nocardioides convexus]|uniref:hypothetical protein n=1 Tax=Nocardioides convexus TaxID=2712224 RepID=UPI002418AFC1|nr:hypothetical protein [Nocardioides convexus]
MPRTCWRSRRSRAAGSRSSSTPATGWPGTPRPPSSTGWPTGSRWSRCTSSLDGTFPNHEANPIEPANLVDLQKRVLAEGADIGLAFDGDADRCFLVDERGEPGLALHADRAHRGPRDSPRSRAPRSSTT